MAKQRLAASLESLVLLVAMLQVLVALGGAPWSWMPGGAELDELGAANQERTLADRVEAVLAWLSIAAFAAFGVLLRLGERSDPATRLLGGWFVLSAAAFSMTPLHELAGSAPSVRGQLAAVLAWLPVEAFVPWFVWRFVAHFPRALDSRTVARLLRAAQNVALILGLGLSLLGFYLSAAQTRPAGDSPNRFFELARSFDPRLSIGLFAPVVYGTCLAAFAMIPWRLRRATVEERRRVRIFATGLGVALLPSLLYVLFGSLGLIEEAWTAWLVIPARLLVLSVLITVCWAIFARDALDVRVLIQKLLWRRAVRDFVGLLFFLPAPLLIWHLLTLDGPLREAWVDQPVIYSGWLLLAMLAPAFRPAALADLDRWFELRRNFGDGHLQRITESLGRAESLPALQRRLRQELGPALGCERAQLLPGDDQRCSTSPREVPAEIFTGLFSLRQEPVLLDRRSGQAALRRMSDPTREWIEDQGWVMLAPVHDTLQRLRAVIAVGERSSQLAYDAADRNLLQGVASACGLMIERFANLEDLDHRHQSAIGAEHSSLDPVPPNAAECVSCLRLSDEPSHHCPYCGNWTTPARVPAMLAGKLEFQQRIANGGEGAIYLARDLVLQRPVAVKALSDFSSQRSAALRAEARSMAAVRHPHLATIYGAEIWQGTLLLLVEHLGGGTLAQRISESPLPWRDVVRLGAQMGRALECVHLAGFRHGDVKPANIVFSEDGTPKLIDFGLTKLSRDVPHSGAGAATPRATAPEMSQIPEDLQGTPLYAPPEVWLGAAATATSDLWSLATVLWEAITGTHPLAAEATNQPRAAMRAYNGPALGDLQGSCPRELARFLQRALAPDPAHRFNDATSFSRALEALAIRFQIRLAEPPKPLVT